MKKYGFATRAIHVGEEPDFGKSGDVVSPIHLSTTFARKNIDRPPDGYAYSRTTNPTRKALETKLAALENAKFALAFSSGLAAETTILLSLLKCGDHILGMDDLYGGTKRLFTQVFNDFCIESDFVDFTNTKNLKEAIKPNTKMVWIESPTNPLLKIVNISEIAKITKEQNLILVVDNTFLSPYFQNPLDLGANIVVHSSTKYMGGHSDVLGGAVLLSDADLYKKLQFHQNAVGAVLSPFDSYLTMRGLKTLSIRMEKHQSNAFALATYLAKHRKVSRLIYPGLKSHSGHLVCKTQSSGFGGVLCFEIVGKVDDAEKFLEKLNVFSLAESLGGVESLIELPAAMTHAAIDKNKRQELGISDTLIRVSVGIEDIEDLIADFEQAFKSVYN